MRQLFTGLAVAILVVSSATWATADDNAIAQSIATQLKQFQAQGTLTGHDINLRVAEGEVLLTGRVTSEPQKTLILETVRNITDVKKVYNGIRVDAPAAPAAPVAPAPPVNRPVSMQTPVAQPRVPMNHQRALPMGAARPYAQASMYQPAPAAGPAHPAYVPGTGGGVAPARYDEPNMPGYAWPSYAASPNYAALTYPKQYSPTAWPYIGPFYPYPQVPLGWRKVTLEWDDGWWMLDFKSK